MKSKQCTKCDELKPLTAYLKEKSSKDGLRRQCQPCRLAAQRVYRATNGRKLSKKLQKDSLIKRRNRNREFVRNYLLTHPCVDCGESRWQVLEFDHIENKLDNISWMIIQARSLKRIENEIAKCEVRCANCHRLKTAKQFGWYAT